MIKIEKINNEEDSQKSKQKNQKNMKKKKSNIIKSIGGTVKIRKSSPYFQQGIIETRKHNKQYQNKQQQKPQSKSKFIFLMLLSHLLYLFSVKEFSDYITDLSYKNRYFIAAGF
ncbi:unnamed protein product [Paramecium sonneborni]|uniref:Transmembrane protein n=1 Tax=Paramecium sonneborni TaxID=65129 RepID=A0A8S1KJZ3_9CILI|nr:unnamed protein product [Paramecium sonneborni]